MRTLVIDSATPACSVALFEGAGCIAGELRLLGRGHAEQLVPMIAALPGRGQAQRIAVALGPGSFTGVRVGLAAARALAFAWGASLVGYSSLALVAALARDGVGGRGPRPVGVVMTGGHGEWFVQRFAADGEALSDLVSAPPDQALALLTAETLLAGSEADAAVARRGHGEALGRLPDARAFALLPSVALRANVTPLYGRAPDARPSLDPSSTPGSPIETPST